MRFNIRNIILFPLFLCFFAASSCTKIVRETDVVVRRNHIHAFVMMSFGYNDLDRSLKQNILDMENGFIPEMKNEEKLLFLYSQGVGQDGKAEKPLLSRIYLNHSGDLVKENLLQFGSDEIPNKGENITKVLNCIKDKYHPDSYGMLISSHGTGWTPPGYMGSPDKFEGFSDNVWSVARLRKQSRHRINVPVPYIRQEDSIAVKSIGVSWTDDGHKNSYETDIVELSKAIPFKLEYIIFDACYMGGVEVAYELKDKCKWLCASASEILGTGMDYSRLLQRLLQSETPNPMAVCTDFYNLYANQSGIYKSATISMTDCSRIDVLAAVCRAIFRAHEINFKQCDEAKLQQFFRNKNRSSQKWFYDLRSVLVAAGADENELADFDWALQQCVVYREATEYFMNDYQIKSFCGLGMYLPYSERAYLNDYYKTLSWNVATGLVK